MSSRVLIAGGYGVIGSSIARHLRKINKDIEIVLGGRNPEQGEALARQLGGARAAYLDVHDIERTLSGLGGVDLIVAALQDPADTLLHAAYAHHIAHIGITKLAGDVAPLTFAALQSPPTRPIVLLGHSDGGVNMLVAQRASKDFRSIASIAVASVYDPLDPIGPMNASDFENNEVLSDRALLRRGGKWEWVNADSHVRQVHIADDRIVDGYPVSLLDVPSLAGITNASDVRWDYVQSESNGTRAGGRASHEVYIDMEGVLHSGEEVKRRIVVSDSNGQAHLTGLGVLVSIERILGLDGKPPAEGAVYLPETLVSTDAAIERFTDFGVRIEQMERR
ncbi:hypothetical protein [Paenibacillus mucilaginosus]|uniref:Saccharopine dehydrogenase n=1 Tax=Paenibacillus mucilaginosus (strain KNP414) TaxID=1036673 RepID=F8F609_PAEMK|nr:hypothetical protein [Paenibacillus mucilaginosus]AEI41897.1 hypothetical protein KNP414_03339 [Paenibacillus mucilaginosus KNP414]MCG7214567.1 hypothetical protein [Paenibacillus mucilaginosus]WDM30844.1 hypothetical protein KCX80_17525 [Paenibacillus mucilaginosus]